MKYFSIIPICFFFIWQVESQENFLDPSFGLKGRATIVFTDGSTTSSPSKMVLEPDGDIFVNGSLINDIDVSKNMGGFFLLKSNGKTDSSKLINGKRAFDLNIRPVENISPSRMIINSKQAIYTSLLQGKNSFSNQLLLGQLAAAYNFNPNFNNGQLVTIFTQSAKDSFIIFNHQMKVSPNDQILISYRKQSVSRLNAANILTRYNENGSLDNTFGNNGRVIIDSNGLNKQFTSSGVLGSNDFFITKQNNILVIGDTVVVGSGNNTSFIKLIRYTSKGLLDPGFGQNGVIKFPNLNISFRAATQDKNDNIYVAGVFPPNNIVLKIKSNGVIDSSFGNKGIVTLDKSFNFSRIELNANQDPIIGGFIVLPTNNTQIQLQYLNQNGTLNTSAGSNGVVSIPLQNPTVSSTISDFSVLATGSVLVLARNILNNSGTSTNGELIKVKSFTTTPLFTKSPSINKFTVYPNPSLEFISLKGIEGSFIATVFTMDGKAMMKTDLSSEGKLPIFSLPAGNFLLQLKDSKNDVKGLGKFSKVN